MHPEHTHISLATLDHVDARTIDPGIWRENLSALRETAPDIAGPVEQVQLSTSWRPVPALDGFATWRIEPPGAAAQWLGGTAAPRVRAAGLLSTYQPGPRNPLLAHLAAGGELDWLLTRLPRWLAVYVLEPDLAVLAAVLRLHDVSAAIRGSRCIFVPPGAEEPFLRGLLRKHPGLLPPGDILLPDQMVPSRLDVLRTLCETVMRAAEEERARALTALVPAASTGIAATVAPPRAAVLSLHDQPHGRAAAAALERGAKSLGWTCIHRDLGGPLDVHLLPHAVALASLEPRVTVCVDNVPAGLPRRLRGVTAVWCTTLSSSAVTAEADLLLAASPKIERALQAQCKGIGDVPVAPWYWACEDATPGLAREDIVLVADLPATDPEAYDVKLSSHQALWKAVQRRCLDAWDSAAILRPEELLREAERQSGFSLADGTARAAMVNMIEQAIAPAAICEGIARALVQHVGKAVVLGSGWERWSDPQLVRADAPVSTLTGSRAMIFVGRRDPLHPDLLAAAAAGCPILLHHPWQAGRAVPAGEKTERCEGMEGSKGGEGSKGAERCAAPWLGDCLRAGEHYAAFGGAADLRARLSALLQDPRPFRERAARARTHVLTHHTYTVRWTTLWRLLDQMGC